MKPCTLAAVLLLAGAPAARAENASPVAETITFVASSGFWQEPAEDGVAGARGYYKLIAVRQADGTAQIHLQRIETTTSGPKIASSTVLEDFSALKPYVTDIRPENSSGVTTQPGLFATVYLKTDPQAAEPESWTVLVDDLGEIRVEQATN